MLRNAAEDSTSTLTAAMLGQAQAVGLAFPLFLDAEDGEIVDAEGVQVIEGVYGYELDAALPVRRLLVAALNVAAGVETPANKPVPMDADAFDRGEFLSRVADRLMEGDDDITREAAVAKATAALDAMLAEEGWVYGEADTYDWDDDGAESLAGSIRRDEADAAEDDVDQVLADVAQVVAEGRAEDLDDDGDITDPKLLALAGVKGASATA